MRERERILIIYLRLLDKDLFLGYELYLILFNNGTFIFQVKGTKTR